MNWTKLIIGIVIVNIVSWLMLEFWMMRYDGGSASVPAGFMVFFQILGYYIVTIGSRIPESGKEDEEDKPIKPQDCPGHDWQKSDYHDEKCLICESERSTKSF